VGEASVVVVSEVNQSQRCSQVWTSILLVVQPLEKFIVVNDLQL
jgi:hypothetical protein